MRRTPEGRVKDRINDVLAAYKPWIFYRMPVQNGMGQPTLDYYGVADGDFFMIEAKAEGEKITARQEKTIAEAEMAGATVFRIIGVNDPTLNQLDNWLRYRAQKRCLMQ